MKVYIIDDDEDVRVALAQALAMEGFATECFASAKDFLEKCQSQMCGCLLLDVKMPGMTGMDQQGKLNELGLDIPIIFLTGAGDIPLSSLAFRGGALDFLEKPIGLGTLLARIEEAFAREESKYEERQIRQRLKERHERLTSRENDILKLLIKGYSSKEMALILEISHRTVEVHRSNIMKKMEAHTLADLVSVAVGLFDIK